METQQPISTELASASQALYSDVSYSQNMASGNAEVQNFNPVSVYQNFSSPQPVYGTQDMNHNIPNYSQNMNQDPFKSQYQYGHVSQGHQNIMYENTDSGLGYESNGMVYNGDVSMNFYSNNSGNHFSHSQVSPPNNNQMNDSQSPTSPAGKRGPGRPTKKVFAPVGKDKAYVCETCFKPLGTYQSLRKHMVTHTGERMYRCHLCSNSYTQKHNLTKHLLVHSGEKPYACEHCSAAFRTRHLLTNHMKRHQKYNPSAVQKPSGMNTGTSMLREILSKSEDMDTSLDQNESSLDSSTLTDTSVEMHSPVSAFNEINSSYKEMSPTFEMANSDYKTSVAGKSDNMVNKVVNQSNKSSKETEKGCNKAESQSEKPKLECDKCEQVFESRIKFMRHKKEHNSSQKKLNCNFCNATFRWKASLDIHLRKHKGEKQQSYELKGLKIKNGNRITLKIGTSDRKDAGSAEAVENHNNAKKNGGKKGQASSPKKMDGNKTEKSSQETKLAKKNDDQQSIPTAKVSPKQDVKEKVDDDAAENSEIETGDTRKRKLSNRKHVENPYIGSMPRSEIAKPVENQAVRSSNRIHKKATENMATEGETQNAETEVTETPSTKAKRFECDLCGQYFTQNFSLKRHKRNKVCSR